MHTKHIFKFVIYIYIYIYILACMLIIKLTILKLKQEGYLLVETL
jgi:hypothetical protein